MDSKKYDGTGFVIVGFIRWTAFFSPVDVHGKVKFSDRREVFKKVRSML
jgi:hypothetical protein